ncbi:MAG: phosphoserine transaminase [Gammaproteobacteria bacterium]|nr:phosphoserine transaminase [Gammaproteobacteria bacterium]
MAAMEKPLVKPSNPCFSSGPCSKRPGWRLEALADALVGRSHRSEPGKARLKLAIDLTREVLGIPAEHRIGIVAGSDTGAIEIAMWNLLGARGVDMLSWESFGQDWVEDVTRELALPDVRVLEADYGSLPDLTSVDFSRDVVFLWNGTTSGVCVPDGDWIPNDRAGLTLCDATSAVFAMPLPWDKLDVVSWSWQKVLGGEGAHGMLVLSPRAVARIAEYRPARPLPKIFRIAERGKLNEAIFTGATINTPSMLCVEDYLDALRWARDSGGLEALIRRSRQNLATIADWVAHTDWIDFLAQDVTTRSSTSICLRLTAPWFTVLSGDEQRKVTKQMGKWLEEEGAAYDIDAYRSAPPGFRIWGGATVESSDIRCLLRWLEWAYARARR